MLSLLIPEDQSAMANNNAELHNFRDTLNNAGIGTWSVDLRTNNLVVSDLARSVFGITSNKLSVRGSLKKLEAAYLRKVYYAFYICLHNHCPILLELQLRNDNNREEDKWICLTGRFNPYSQEFSGLVFDISKQKNCDAKAAALIAKLNHELRGPLCTIKLYTQQSLNIARTEHLSVASYLEKADQQISWMQNMVEDFLLVSTAENQKLILHKTFFLVRTLLTEVLSDYFAGQYNNRVMVQIDHSHKVYADRDKLTQVLINYISNAVKYSPANSNIIVSSVKLKGEFKLTVRDFGIGVSLSEQKKLFQKYFRCSSVADIQGYGIGLFVVREIMEAHQGRFGLISKPGEGSTFYITLPLNVQ